MTWQKPYVWRLLLLYFLFFSFLYFVFLRSSQTNETTTIPKSKQQSHQQYVIETGIEDAVLNLSVLSRRSSWCKSDRASSFFTPFFSFSLVDLASSRFVPSLFVFHGLCLKVRPRHCFDSELLNWHLLKAFLIGIPCLRAWEILKESDVFQVSMGAFD